MLVQEDLLALAKSKMYYFYRCDEQDPVYRWRAFPGARSRQSDRQTPENADFRHHLIRQILTIYNLCILQNIPSFVNLFLVYYHFVIIEIRRDTFPFEPAVAAAAAAVTVEAENRGDGGSNGGGSNGGSIGTNYTNISPKKSKTLFLNDKEDNVNSVCLINIRDEVEDEEFN